MAAADELRENNLRSWVRQGIPARELLKALDTAVAAAVDAAESAAEAQRAAAAAVADNTLGVDSLGRVLCPNGVTPNRPTARTDVSYLFFSPTPPSTADGKMMPGVDFWCVLDV